ncbi:MAG: DUF1330 domain-containing protein [Pseudomonadota bacterium]
MWIVRFLLVALFASLTATARAADGGYFIAIGVLNDERGGDYETFLRKVQPVWERHGMSIVLRVKTRFVLHTKGDPVPDDITVLRYENRAGFTAYLSDPEYQSIKALRENALDYLTIMEAQAVKMDGLPQLAKTPMALVRLDKERVAGDDPALVLMADLVVNVKGSTGFWGVTRQVRFSPLSFDDNPMTGAQGSPVLSLAGDLVR